MISQKLLLFMACVLGVLNYTGAQAQGNPQKGDPQQQAPQREKQKPKASEPNVSASTVEPESANKSLAQAEVYEPNCGKPKSQPDADLCVQRRVADAAEDALHWTKIQTGGALVGLVLVLATLGVTAWTGKAASIAAQAAIDAVGAERAWMSQANYHATIAADSIIDGVKHERAVNFNIGWRNTGRSPALQVEAMVDIKCCKIGEPAPVFDIIDNPNKDEAGVVGPGVEISIDSPWLFGNELESFLSRNSSVYVYSRIYYYTTEAPTVRRLSEFSGMVYCNNYTRGYTSRDAYKDTMIAKGRNTAS